MPLVCIWLNHIEKFIDFSLLLVEKVVHLRQNLVNFGQF